METEEQKLAINKEGENIIVSAGAGSGKTMVLSKRVLRKVLEGVPVDHLLVLTFTREAAKEMSKRIRNRIKENLDKNPSLIEQLNKLDNSYITTFDSFSLSIVRKYHYLINVKKDINIIDSNVLDIKINEILDSLMEEEYIKREPLFTKLISDFCIKDDYLIKDVILKYLHKLDMKYDKDDYLDSYIDEFYNPDTIKYNIPFGKIEKGQYYINIIGEVSFNGTIEYFEFFNIGHDLRVVDPPDIKFDDTWVYVLIALIIIMLLLIAYIVRFFIKNKNEGTINEIIDDKKQFLMNKANN